MFEVNESSIGTFSHPNSKQPFVRDSASCLCGPQFCCLVLDEAPPSLGSWPWFLNTWIPHWVALVSLHIQVPYWERVHGSWGVILPWDCVCTPTQCLAEEMPYRRRCIGLRGLPQAGWFEQCMFVCSQFWRLETWDQGVSRVSFFFFH